MDFISGIHVNKMVNVILLCPVTGTVVCVFTPHTACRSAMAEKVTHLNYTLFTTAARILGSHHFFFFMVGWQGRGLRFVMVGIWNDH